MATNRPTNNILGYERLDHALDRMAGTVIKTTIETGDEAEVQGFSLISSFKYNRKGSMHAERLRYLEVTLCEWLFRAIESAEVLPISREYFRLRRPLDRRLYEIARKHCGQKERWRIGIDEAAEKMRLQTGTQSLGAPSTRDDCRRSHARLCAEDGRGAG